MKQLFLACCALILWINSNGSQAQVNPFVVTPSSPVQNMVAGSSQQITYSLTSNAPKSQPAIVKCTFTPDKSSTLSYSFNDAGCVSGVGLYKGLEPVEVLLTLSLPSGATSPQKGTLTFKQSNGMGYKVSHSISITVASNAQRTVTFTNYCLTPLGEGNNTGLNVVIGISSSSTPAQSVSTSSAVCTTDSDCSPFTYSTCVKGIQGSISPCESGDVNCYCGGGACLQDTDCINTHAGTCAAPIGSMPGTPAACTYCALDSDCIAGATCNTNNNQCYWNLPTPKKNNVTHYQLAEYHLGSKNPDSATITIPDNTSNNGFSLQWSGAFTARTGCAYDTTHTTYHGCNIGDCNPKYAANNVYTNGACEVGAGFTAPTTNAEVTFVGLTPDTYDVTIINGASNALDMYPIGVSSPQTYHNPYLCGTPGAPFPVKTDTGTIGASRWNFTLPKHLTFPINFFQLVDSAATSCHTTSDCTGLNPHYVCGLAATNFTYNSGSGNYGQSTCGHLLGYLTADQICGQSSNNGTATAFTIYNANSTAVVTCNSNYSSNNYYQLLSCSGDAATSCYNVNGKTATCCGCTNWQNQGILVPTNPVVVSQCKYPNAYWVGTSTIPGVLPYLTWLKQACPSCYVFPYDDKSSTFSCPANNGQAAVNYHIEFCPQNKG